MLIGNCSILMTETCSGSFEPDVTLPNNGFTQFEQDIVDSVTAFKAASVEQVLIDLSNNG